MAIELGGPARRYFNFLTEYIEDVEVFLRDLPDRWDAVMSNGAPRGASKKMDAFCEGLLLLCVGTKRVAPTVFDLGHRSPLGSLIWLMRFFNDVFPLPAHLDAQSRDCMDLIQSWFDANLDRLRWNASKGQYTLGPQTNPD